MGEEVVGIDEVGTVNGAFDLLASGVLGAATKFGAAFGTFFLSEHLQLVVGD